MALNGLPGPYIKHFMSQIGHEGLNAMLVGFPTKAAEAVCTFAYSAGPGILLYILKVNTAEFFFFRNGTSFIRG